MKESAVGCLTLCMVRFDVLSANILKPLYSVVGCSFLPIALVFLSVKIVPNVFFREFCG